MASYEIIGGDLQVVQCDLQSGEKVIAETGHLLSMTDGLTLDTKAAGGFVSSVRRSLGGSSFFINEIFAKQAGRAVFASPTPGKIQKIELSPSHSWFCQPHVFLCADEHVKLDSAFTKKFGAGLFGGTGFILQSLQGRGSAFIHVAGACLSTDLKDGESIRVETGALAAFEASVSYDIQMVEGLRSILFSGEGLWFAHLTGPGRVYIQSLAVAKLAHLFSPYLTAGEATAAGGVGGIIGGILKNI